VACTCTNGATGAQTCAANGSGYGICICTSAPGTGGAKGPGGSSGGASGGTAGGGVGGTAGTGGTAGGGVGGTAGGGVGGTAGGSGMDGIGGDPCAGTTVTDANTISDFEDGTGSVLHVGNPRRNGVWYAYNDGIAGNATGNPNNASCSETPAHITTYPIPAQRNDPPRCGSAYSFSFHGTGCAYAGIGADLNDPLPDPDASADSGGADAGTTVMRLIPYDLSGYKQIKFWGKLGPMAMPLTQQVQFKLPMLVDTKVQDGGICVDSDTAKCSDSYGQFMIFTTNWTLYTVDLVPDSKTGISQEFWGRQFAWDPTNVVAIQFQAASYSTYDIWIDDIALVPRDTVVSEPDAGADASDGGGDLAMSCVSADAGPTAGGADQCADSPADGGGGLDPSFGVGGIVDIQLGAGSYSEAMDVAVDGQGRLLVAVCTHEAAAVARLLDDGQLDGSFGQAGIAHLPSGKKNLCANTVRAVGGKIVGAGGGSDLIVFRLLDDGTLDSSFGAGGLVTVDVGPGDLALHVAVEPDGSVVAYGVVGDPGPPDLRLVLVKVTAQGVLDPAFGTAGVVTIDSLRGAPIPDALMRRADGSLLLVASANPHHYLLRRLADGSKDPTFGSDGMLDLGSSLTLDGGSTVGAALTSDGLDGRIVVAGGSSSSWEVARLMADGCSDPTFGTGGRTLIPVPEPVTGFGYPSSVAVTRSGLFVAGGDGTNMAIARLSCAGEPRTMFGAGGVLITPIGSSSSQARAVAVDGSGRIVMAGGEADPKQIRALLARVTP